MKKIYLIPIIIILLFGMSFSMNTYAQIITQNISRPAYTYMGIKDVHDKEINRFILDSIKVGTTN